MIESLKPDNVGLPKGTEILMEEISEGFKCKIMGEFELSSFIRTWNDLIASVKLLKNLIEAFETE